MDVYYGVPGGGPGTFEVTAIVIIGVVLVAAWVILASSRFIGGGVVERPERVPQLYGYTVCLVALLWALVSLGDIVESSLTLSAPQYGTAREFPGMEPSLSSFEAFRSTYERARYFSNPDPAARRDTVSDAELRRRYEALRADRIQRTIVESRRSIIVHVIFLLIAITLFVVHWRWLRRISGAAPFGTTRTDI